MKKLIVLGVLILGLSSCRSSRPRYLRCPKGKRCVQVQFKKQTSFKGINTIKKTHESLIF